MEYSFPESQVGKILLISVFCSLLSVSCGGGSNSETTDTVFSNSDSTLNNPAGATFTVPDDWSVSGPNESQNRVIRATNVLNPGIGGFSDQCTIFLRDQSSTASILEESMPGENSNFSVVSITDITINEVSGQEMVLEGRDSQGQLILIDIRHAYVVNNQGYEVLCIGDATHESTLRNVLQTVRFTN